jgi:DNA-binding transcriptional regulator YiaG
MSGQIHAGRKRLGLAPEEFAAALVSSGKDRCITVWSWETGRKPSTQTVALMKQLTDGT